MLRHYGRESVLRASWNAVWKKCITSTVGTLCEAASMFAVANAWDNYDTDKYKIEAGYHDSPERVIPAINKTLKEASGVNKVTLSYRYT